MLCKKWHVGPIHHLCQMPKWHVRTGAILLAILLWPAGVAQAQASASATAQTRAILLRPASLVETQDLEFGDIVPSMTLAGTVTIAPVGTRTSTGGVTPILNNFAAARFAGLGTPNRLVLLNVVPNQVDITNANGATMRANNFTIGNLAGLTKLGGSNQYRITSANGVIGFSVGARLNIAANQDPGDYSGIYQVNFNYQ